MKLAFKLLINTITDRVIGYLSLIMFAASRLRQLRKPELRIALLRQIAASGSSALILVVLLGMVSGGMLVSQLLPLLGESNVSGRNLLLGSLNYELAPLFCALVVIARNSAGIASELALMHLHNEFVALERVGIPAAEYLITPRIAGLAFATPILTVVFQCAALLAGVFMLAMGKGVPFDQPAGEILAASQVPLILFGLLKAVVFGVLIGAISCHHGAYAERSPLAVSEESINAVGRSLAAVLVFDGLCALGVFALRQL